MYPGTHAADDPDRAAVVMGESGEVVTYGQLDARSNQLAHHLRGAGLRAGDHLAVVVENHPRSLEIVWAGLRSGLYVTAVNHHLTPAEAGYIVDDAGASALVSSAHMGPLASGLIEHTPRVRDRLMVDGTVEGYGSYESAIGAQPATPIEDESLGELMLYSSGTTGRPKGIKRPLSGAPASDGNAIVAAMQAMYGFEEGCTYLSPAPLYHSAPLQFSASVLCLGGTVVVMERFDPALALALIERHRVTHSQWVPTMFIRMLKLAPEERAAHDLSSLRVAIHAAAPCPVWVKEQMIDWWGPILTEYYAGTEGNGATVIDSAEWLEHKGSVGKPTFAPVHICDESGVEQPAGEPGVIYFENPTPMFEYHNDPEKTTSTLHPEHPTWSTLGDVGFVDDDGYLYLTDRRTFMIVSGGVNIYPQETENVLIEHDQVADVAVIGVPDDDLGEAVKAVVQPVAMASAGSRLADELIAYCRERLAPFKCPRSVDFDAALPRSDTGKLYKRELRQRYWVGHETVIR